MNSLDALGARAVAAMRTYLDADESARTGLLKGLAEVFVDARAHFFNREGTPDWAGRTYAYRMWVREAYSMANVPPSSRTAMQAATRWHVGEVLRDRLAPATLEAAGLDPKSPRERNVDARAERASARNLVGPGPELTDAEDIAAVGEVFDVTLRRIPVGVTATMSEVETRAIVEAWAPVWERLNAASERFTKHTA